MHPSARARSPDRLGTRARLSLARNAPAMSIGEHHGRLAVDDVARPSEGMPGSRRVPACDAKLNREVAGAVLVSGEAPQDHIPPWASSPGTNPQRAWPRSSQRLRSGQTERSRGRRSTRRRRPDEQQHGQRRQHGASDRAGDRPSGARARRSRISARRDFSARMMGIARGDARPGEAGPGARVRAAIVYGGELAPALAPTLHGPDRRRRQGERRDAYDQDPHRLARAAACWHERDHAPRRRPPRSSARHRGPRDARPLRADRPGRPADPPTSHDQPIDRWRSVRASVRLGIMPDARCPHCRRWSRREQWATAPGQPFPFVIVCPRCDHQADVAEVEYRSAT
jgi:hypothetical protein